MSGTCKLMKELMEIEGVSNLSYESIEQIKMIICGTHNGVCSERFSGIKEYINKYKINIRYGYNELYPKEEYNTIEENFHISQIGTCNFKDLIFYPEIGEDVAFKFESEFEVEHDVIVGLPVYITISKNK